MKNQASTSLEFEKVEVINRAMNLAFAALSGDINLINEERKNIESVTREDMIRVANEVFQESNSSVLYYQSESLGI